MNVRLNPQEIEFLKRPVNGTGGFQALLRRLRGRLDVATGELRLTAGDLERIPRYAFDYQNGGWQSRLLGIFERHLGPHLGR